MDCNTETEQTRPWLIERSGAKNLCDKRQPPQEESGDIEVERDKESASRTNSGNDDPNDAENDNHGNDINNSSGGQIQQNDEEMEDEEYAEDEEIESEEELEWTDSMVTTRRVNSSYEHHWSHDMILCQPQDSITATVTVEDRLSALEIKLQDQEKVISDGVRDVSSRLESLEGMLNRLIDPGAQSVLPLLR